MIEKIYYERSKLYRIKFISTPLINKFIKELDIAILEKFQTKEDKHGFLLYEFTISKKSCERVYKSGFFEKYKMFWTEVAKRDLYFSYEDIAFSQKEFKTKLVQIKKIEEDYIKFYIYKDIHVIAYKDIQGFEEDSYYKYLYNFKSLHTEILCDLLIKTYKADKPLEFTVKEFMEKIYLYDFFGYVKENIKIYVINPIKEINDSGLMKVEFEEIKKNNKVIKVKFKIDKPLLIK